MQLANGTFRKLASDNHSAYSDFGIDVRFHVANNLAVMKLSESFYIYWFIKDIFRRVLMVVPVNSGPFTPLSAYAPHLKSSHLPISRKCASVLGSIGQVISRCEISRRFAKRGVDGTSAKVTSRCKIFVTGPGHIKVAFNSASIRNGGHRPFQNHMHINCDFFYKIHAFSRYLLPSMRTNTPGMIVHFHSNDIYPQEEMKEKSVIFPREEGKPKC